MLWKTIVFVLILIVLGIGIYNLRTENRKLELELGRLGATLQGIEEENTSLLSKIDYYKSPQNLLKELKSQFNYREDGEEMIIIVPRN